MEKAMGPAAFNPQIFLSQPGAGKKILRCNKKHRIYSQGDPGTSLFYLTHGRVRLVVTSPQGKEAVVGLLEPGDFFGQESLTGHKGRLATALAMSDCTVTRIEKSLVNRLMRQGHEFSQTFIAYLLAHAVRVQEDLIDQLFNSSEKRLARTLLLLARFGMKGKRPSFLAPDITHEVLAEMVGTTRARITFFMNKFRGMGFLEYNGGLRIKESLLDVVLHE
jgi:CRP/FNR family transcriptional regulator, cyclic AMP receptor protein